MSEYIDYIPVPEWNGSEWIPTDHTKYGDGPCGYAIMKWPKRFDPKTIPHPKHNIGDHVRFNWDNGIREGQIRSIHLHGGGIRRCENIPDEIKKRYFSDPQYTIYWNGHGRWVYERNIVGA